MPWLQLKINSSRKLAPKLESALQTVGAQAVTMEDNADQPIFEPELGETPLWQETCVTGLFEADIDSDAILAEVERLYLQKAHIELQDAHWHLLEDKDWEREWMTHYHPIQCADKLWICPSWTPPPDPAATNIMLDPGLAFGTGTHPTTFLCLQWLAEQDMTEKTAIDYGCGSGILGIACLLLGAKHVSGTDIDPQALLATQDNVTRNDLAADCFPVFFPDKCPTEPCDLVAANILAGPLVELAPTLIALLKAGGKICLSGVLSSQQDAIVAAYGDHIDFNEVRTKDEWICVTGTKRH
ncbi:50S ribosomal protein L11 methyltransferase [Teredinibacter waterburyi]|uniref:50S ribosomal protein L11 methyltransferase n=1 Tax=Teredinibacter waterburyi TaxID=1500538 RepID=UPI00165F8BB5|nr:50S ribosomal protein L11 methyltransferase [Teredinibacter waterburyi]